MGLIFSHFLGSAEPEPPPSVVLVPPLLERERKGRSRFAKSSYDRCGFMCSTELAERGAEMRK